MAYQTVPSRINGQVIDQTWFNLEKANLDNLNTRLNDNFETKILYLPLWYYGDANHYTLPLDGAMITKITNTLLLMDCELFVPKAGTAGTLLIDLEYSDDDGGSWHTVFSTPPSIDFSVGDYQTSINGQINTLFDEILGGWMLRLNIDTTQTNLEAFCVRLSALRQSLSGV